MSTIALDSLTFYYDSPLEKIFDNVSLNIDTKWKLGVVGKNGRGKTTFFKLLLEDITPVDGLIKSDVSPVYFPYRVTDEDESVFNIIKDGVAPFRKWEKKMEELLELGDKKSLDEYGETLNMFTDSGGYEIDSMIGKEIVSIGLDTSLLNRKFESLSGGEKTRVLLIPMFLRKNAFPLIDEPTNHLDINGREGLGEYLKGKSGYIVISHDRAFLDTCTDHIMSINKSDVRINKGSYSSWKYNMEIEEEFERNKNEKLKREIKQLEESAKRKRAWSVDKEKEKKGAYDKGFVGHRAAKMMKRALSIENRVNDNLEEKKDLLRNYEKERILKLNVRSSGSGKVAALYNINKSFEKKAVLQDISFTVNSGDRVAVIGPNGSGKTTLLKIITGEVTPDSGSLDIPGSLTVAQARQIPLWNSGLLREHLYENKMDETKFRNILGSFGSGGDLFERPLETFSMGELKKVELCRSFVEPVDLLIWDEPMNYIDIAGRESIEKVILESTPTMIFIEHDKAFIENVSTNIIEFSNILIK